MGKRKKRTSRQRAVSAYSYSSADVTVRRPCDDDSGCDGTRKPCPFRDAEAAYEAQYYARLEARKKGVLFNETPSAMGATALHKEVAKCLEKGPKKEVLSLVATVYAVPVCLRAVTQGRYSGVG